MNIYFDLEKLMSKVERANWGFTERGINGSAHATTKFRNTIKNLRVIYIKLITPSPII